jgi:hypothetical protein
VCTALPPAAMLASLIIPMCASWASGRPTRL